MAEASCLVGRRILVVEDEFLIALDVEGALSELGCSVVGPAATVSEALQLIETDLPHAAVLDVRLADGSTAPVADALSKLSLPYLVLTGYERQQVREPALRDAPMLTKPLQRSNLRQLLLQVLPA